ncbi:MAG: hypothetical protein GX621_15330, partial [Pirellulaceae bacterium]|nr:hypothetical protein [Pirellulaceae bacterium]
MKLQFVAAVLAMMLVAGLTSPELLWAGTDLSNVAWKQPVTGNSYGQPWYGRAFAADASGYTVVSNTAARALINDEFTGAYGWAYPNADGGGAWIDLGAEYDIAHIELIPKSSSDWSKLQLATVYGSSLKTTDAEYSFIIPTKSSSNASHVQLTDKWRGVRWIRIVDETDTMNLDNRLTIGEVRV